MGWLISFSFFFVPKLLLTTAFSMGDLQRFTNRQYERLLGFSRKLDNRDFLKPIAELYGAPAGFVSSADLFLQQTRCRPHEHLSNQRRPTNENKCVSPESETE